MNHDLLADAFNTYGADVQRLVTYRLFRDYDVAEDVCGDLWERMVTAACEPTPDATRRYIYRSARNAVIDQLRRWRTFQPLNYDDSLPEAISPGNLADDLIAQHELERIMRALRQISPAQEEVLRLRVLEGYSIADAAQVLGCRKSTIKMRQFYAVRNIRTLLGAD